MVRIYKITFILVIALMVLSGQSNPSGCGCSDPDIPGTPTGQPDPMAGTDLSKAGGEPASAEAAKAAQLPLLLDLGAGKCIPCKMMEPILHELEADYNGVMDVRFIDVWKAPEEGRKYSVRIIPTQIFYDSEGKELFRHEGFFSKEDILAKWKELGFDLKPSVLPKPTVPKE